VSRAKLALFAAWGCIALCVAFSSREAVAGVGLMAAGPLLVLAGHWDVVGEYAPPEAPAGQTRALRRGLRYVGCAFFVMGLGLLVSALAR
jgi:hypothetical protein